MTTSDKSPSDAGRNPSSNPADGGNDRSSLGGSQRLSSIRDQDRSPAPHSSAPRSNAGSSASSASGDGGDHTDKLFEAVSRLCDSMETVVREIPRGAQAQLSGVKEKLAQAREALASCGCDSIDASGKGASSKGSSSRDTSSDVRRAEGEGMSTNRGSQTSRL